jgi:protein SCO1/2
MSRKLAAMLLIVAVLPGAASFGQANQPPEVGIEEHLGEVIDLEPYTFTDESGKKIALKELFDRPVVLTLVYFRCPGICTPLLNDLAHAVDLCDLKPGEDYRLVTVSFDPGDTSDLAFNKKKTLLATMKEKEVPPDSWRFLTGDEDNIKRLTEAVGFRYKKDKNQVDYVHAGVVTFLAANGKIVRYLHGTEFNPADLKLAVIDAKEGRARSFMQKITKLCFAYDPESRGYVLQMNRVILGITVVFVMAFGAFLLLKGRGRSRPTRDAEGESS